MEMYQDMHKWDESIDLAEVKVRGKQIRHAEGELVG